MKPDRFLLEDYGGDLCRMLSHLHQIWCRRQFREADIQGVPEDRESHAGICVPPGMPEIPFCLLLNCLPMREYYIEIPQLLLSASMTSGRIYAVCMTSEAVGTAQLIKEELPLFHRARTHVKPDTVVENVSMREGVDDPLVFLFARAEKLPTLKGKLYVVLNHERRYAICGQRIPKGSKGAFFGFDYDSRAFVAYDTYSDMLVCYGPAETIANFSR